MTRKKIIFFSFFFFIAGVFADYFYQTLISKHYNEEKCTASLIVFYEDTRANLTLDFMYNLKEHRGVVAVSGNYIKNNRPAGNIRRDVSYTWTENKDTYNFTSTMVNKVKNIETLSDDIIALVMPDFYVYPQKYINYSIQNQGDSGFLFTIGKRPLFFCAR